MDHNIAVGRRDFLDVPSDDRIERFFAGDLFVRKNRVEPFLVQVVEDGLMTGCLKLFDGRLGDHVTEASRLLMAEEDEDVHCSG